MASPSEQLTEAFYNWEIRGRGWQVFDAMLEPEPPFTPFLGHFLDHDPASVTDDGRADTLLSGFTRWFKSNLFIEDEPEAVEPAKPILYLHDPGELVHLQIVLPPDITYPKDVGEQLILNLGACRHPVCLEFFGASDEVTVTLVVDASDADTALTQLQNHFPEAIITASDDRLMDEVLDGPGLSVEFGLADEFMLPLRSYRAFAPDPLTGLVAQLGALRDLETAGLQIMFRPVRHPWAESVARAVTGPDGQAFFANAPGLVEAAAKKIASPLYGVVIRGFAQSQCENNRPAELLRQIAGTLSVTDEPSGNRLIPLSNEAYEDFDGFPMGDALIERRSFRSGMLLSLDELATFVHLPGASVVSPALVRHAAKTKPAPAICLDGEVALGENPHAGHHQTIFQTAAQRARHTYVIGASGSGKSKLLAGMIRQDMAAGRGVGVLDPHGDLIDDLLGHVPDDRVEDVVLLDLADEDYPVPFNILNAHSDLEKNLLASDLAGAFQKLATSWGDQMTAVLSNAILAVLESDRGGTFIDLRRFLVEPKFRAKFLPSVQDEEVRYYWEHEFSLATGKPQGSVVTRLNTFLRPKPIRYMVGHGANRLDMAGMMDAGKIFLARIPQGAIGEENAHLLGTLLVSGFQRAALTRQSVAAAERKPFNLFIDEFHHFVTPSMAQILSGARKYGLQLVLAHQELRQLESRDPDVASAVLSNPATRVCFRLGETDAKRMVEGLSGFDARDLQNLRTGEAIARVERAEWDFNLSVPLPPEVPASEAVKKREAIREHCRRTYAVTREEVAAKLAAQRPQLRNDEDGGDTQAEASKTEQPKPDAPEPVVVIPPVAAPPPAPESLPTDASVADDDPVRTNEPGEAATVDDPLSTPGRGGLKHKSLQRMIKQTAEGLGLRAQIEKPILNGRGAVDVAITGTDFTVACEISITTPTAHEMQNLAKCIEADFTHVAMVSDDEKHLKAIERRAKKTASGNEFGRVLFVSPTQLFSFIEGLGQAAKPSTSTVRGYRVTVEAGDTAPSRERLKSIQRTVARASTRRKANRKRTE
ncbi:MAG: TraM recognition domain-containing protein [Planctomycetota bacterium]